MDEIDVKRLRLEPGDIVVLRTKERLPLGIVERLRNELVGQVPGYKVLILDSDMEISRLTPADVEAIRADQA